MPSEFEGLWERVRNGYDVSVGFNALAQAVARTSRTFQAQFQYVECSSECESCYPSPRADYAMWQDTTYTFEAFEAVLPAPVRRLAPRPVPIVRGSTAWFNGYYATSGDRFASRVLGDYPLWFDDLWDQRNSAIERVIERIEEKMAVVASIGKE
jgi:hypothetical protein